MDGKGHNRLVQFYANGIGVFWESNDLHLSSDTSIAKSKIWEWFSLDAMQDWNAFIGTRQVNELSRDPSKRKYHRYIPYPASIRNKMDREDELRVKLVIHHQLLTGVVIYVDTGEISEEELRALDYCVVNKKGIISSEGQYVKGSPGFKKVTYIEAPIVVAKGMDLLWEAKNKKGVMRLYYRYPHTFDHQKHYISDDMRQFLLFVQNNTVFDGKNWIDSSSVDIAIDHIIPRSDGGTNILINLMGVERYYNSVKKKDRKDALAIDIRKLFMSDKDPVSISPKYLELLTDGCLSMHHIRTVHNYMKAHAKKRLGLSL